MLDADVAPAYGAIVTKYWQLAGVAMRERLKVDQAHAVIDLVAAGAGFALVPSSVDECGKQRIVCRRLNPAPPELELSLAWARGVDSPAINALLGVARQVLEQPRVRGSRGSGADSRLGGSDLAKLFPNLLAATGHVRTNGHHGEPSRLLSEPKLPRRDGDGAKSIGTTQARRVRAQEAS
jgi:hypothetical protein